jgi:hypothetical protein
MPRVCLARKQSVIESAKDQAEVHFSTRLQAQQKFTSASRGEVDFTPALHP